MDTPLDKVEKKIDSALTRNPKLLVVTPLSVVALLSYFSGVLGWGPILPCLVVAGLLMALSSRQKRADIVRLAWLRGESRRMRSLDDWETVEWLNQQIGTIWVTFGTRIGIKAAEWLDAFLAANPPIPMMKRVSIKRIFLGTQQAKITKLRSYARVPSNEMHMDAVVVWADNDAEVVMVCNFGVSLPILVHRLYFRGKVHVQVRLDDEYPFIDTLQVSLLEEPTVEFSVRPLHSVDVMDVPWISNLIRQSVNEFVHNALLDPNSLTIPIKALFLDREMTDADSDSPTYFRPSVGIISVRVQSANHVPRREILGYSNPYVKLAVSQQFIEMQTQTRKRSSQPTWNEGFYFLVQDLKEQQLVLKLFDHKSVASDELLGTSTLPLSKLSNGKDKKPQTFTLPVEGGGEATLQFEAQFFSIAPTTAPALPATADGQAPAQSEVLKVDKGILQVTINGAEQLSSARADGEIDSYVIVKTGGTRLFRSVVKKDTASPSWNETFETLMLDPSMPLHFVIKDSNLLMNAFLGEYILKLEDVKFSRAEPTTMWLTLWNTDCGKLSVTLKYTPLDIHELLDDFAGGHGATPLAADPQSRRGWFDRRSRRAAASYSNDIMHSTTAKMLNLTIHSATDLIAADSNGLSDPYVTVQVGGMTLFRSSVKKKTLSPVWEETVQIPVDFTRTPLVIFTVMDYDALTSDDFLGSLSLDEATLKQAQSKAFPLSKVPSGRLCISAEMKPLSVGPGDASAAAGTSSASIAAASNNTITANNTSRTTNTTTNGAPHATTTATDEANAPPKRKRSLLLQRPRLHRGRSQSVDLGNVEAPAVAAVAANRVADTSRSGGVETRVVAGADVLVSDLSSDEDLSARSSVSTVRRMSAPTATTSQALINDHLYTVALNIHALTFGDAASEAHVSQPYVVLHIDTHRAYKTKPASRRELAADWNEVVTLRHMTPTSMLSFTVKDKPLRKLIARSFFHWYGSMTLAEISTLRVEEQHKHVIDLATSSFQGRSFERPQLHIKLTVTDEGPRAPGKPIPIEVT